MDMTLNRAYTGDLPFAAANYCDDDFDRVFPILKILQNNDCRLWYKEGEQTDETQKNRNRERESVVLSFISGKALESHDWRKEFNTAVLAGKSIIAVLFDDTVFTPVMKRQMEQIPVVSYMECKTDGACCMKLLQMPEMKKCLEEEKTVLIPKASVKKYYLKRKVNSERICISKSGFTIGRKSVCDYVISDNVTISRVHAVFDIEDGICTVMDNHSTNKVYVNDQALNEDEKRQVKSGDVIEVGSEKFIVEVVE